MTTTADIVNDLNHFLQSLDGLLATATAKEAPNIARDLGAVPQLNGTLAIVDRGLATLDEGVKGLADAIVKADSLIAGFEILAAFITDFGKGEALTDVSTLLELPDNAFQVVADGIAKGGQHLAAGLGLADALPSPGGLRDTRDRLQKLQGSVVRLKALPGPAAANPVLNRPLGGNNHG